MTKENDNICDRDNLEVITDHFEKNPETEKTLAEGFKISIIILSLCVGLPAGILLAIYGIKQYSKFIAGL